MKGNGAKKIITPLTEETVESLVAGEEVLLSGVLYVARDIAHKRIVEALEKGEPLPFDLINQVIYYMGPAPARPGCISGSAGPTTSGRMDPYAPRLIEAGLKGMIGKGARSQAVKDAIKAHKAVYLGAVGGIGALLARAIIRSDIIAYADLGPEAVRRLEVKDFPVIVIYDARGGDLYEAGRAEYRRRKG